MFLRRLRQAFVLLPQIGGSLASAVSLRRASQAAAPGTGQKRKLWLLVIPVTTFCLGTWQVFRLQWKLDLIADLERRTKKEVINIPLDIADRLKELEYRRVRVHGYFDHGKELYMWPRVLNTTRTGQGRAEHGTQVVTPFFCHSLNAWILISRGWVPRKKTDPASRPDGQVEGDVSLSAVVRTTEKRAPFAPKNKPEQNHWSFRDVEAMAQQVGAEPILLDADASSTVPGGPIGGQTRVTLRNDHLQYIFTWYCLTLATGYMFWLLWKRTGARSGKVAAQKLYDAPPRKRRT